MGIVCSSTDNVNYYSTESYPSHVSSRSRRGWGTEKSGSRRFSPSCSSVDPSSFVDPERSGSIPGTQYNFSASIHSSVGPGTSMKSAQSAQAETVTSPLRPVSNNKIKLAAVADFFPDVKKMLIGRLDDEMEISLEKRVIYVYHCAFHTDSLAEKQELQNHVYPWLREYCRERGACLEIIDLPWNLKDFHACRHACRKLPLPILKELLTNQGDRTIITVMLNEKYGTYWIPLEIEENDFHLILKKVTEDEKKFVSKWYKLSDTLEPPSYILQPVEKYCEKYASQSVEEFREGLREWEKQHLRLRNIMNKAAPQANNKLYQTSDLERDLRETVLADLCAKQNIVLLSRKLTSMQLDDAMRYKQLEDFIDINGEHLNEVAQAKLRALTNSMLEKVDEERRVTIEVPWLSMVTIGSHGDPSVDLLSESKPTSKTNDVPARVRERSVSDVLHNNATRAQLKNNKRITNNKVAKSEILELENECNSKIISNDQESTEVSESFGKDSSSNESENEPDLETGSAKKRRREFSLLKRRKCGTVRGDSDESEVISIVGKSAWNDSIENEKDRKNYLANLSISYRMIMKDLTDDILSKLHEQETRKQVVVSRGLTESLYSEITLHSKLAMDYRFSFLGQNDFMKQLEALVAKGNGAGENVCYPVLIHGATGMGKTAAMSVLAANVFSLDKWKQNGACIVRFAGMSKDSLNIEHVVYSIAEQLCVLLSLPLRIVAEHKAKILHHLLDTNKHLIPSSQNILIILDGLDQLHSAWDPGFENFAWLPKELSGSVRLILTATTKSNACIKLRDYLGEHPHFMEIPRLFPADQFSILICFMQQYQRSVGEQTQQQICQHIHASGSPLLIQVISVCLLHYSHDLAACLRVVGGDIKEIVNFLLSLIEKQFGRAYMSALGCMLVCTRYGISQNEFLDIASCHPGVCAENLVRIDSTNNEIGNRSQRVPCLQWYAITSTLHPFLHFHVSHGLHLARWKHTVFADVCKERYHDDMEQIRTLLQSYWFSELNTQKLSHVQKQPLKFSSSVYNGRVLDEMLQSFASGTDIYKDTKVFNAVFLQGLVENFSTFEVLRQLQLLPSCGEISLLHSIIQHLEPALITSKQTFLLHLFRYITLNNIHTENLYPVLHDLFKLTQKQLPPLLTPLHGLGTFTYGYNKSELKCDYTNTGIYRIKGDDDHMVITARDQNEVKIFNFHTELNHRVLKDVDLPRDVRIINMFRAVILCDRQLHIYDLDKGKLFSRLKGILNLRMPYFGILNEEHTMAMSRNRMYVNMLHNITGEVVTTFKVGEDRFLNSLLVSDNGEVCVCGDEVHKPFPLLVWNLKHRKLIHDFRIRGHEFLTSMAAITKDGHYVVTVCREVEDPEPNFLIAYDLQNGTMFTKIKPQHSCTAVTISQEAGIIVSTHDNGHVLVWNLNDSAVAHSPKFVLTGHTVGADVLHTSDDGRRGVTYDSKGRDLVIWMWDFVQGRALGCIPSLTGASCCQISADGRAVIVAWPQHDRVHTFHAPDEPFMPNLQSVYGDSARNGKVFHMDK